MWSLTSVVFVQSRLHACLTLNCLRRGDDLNRIFSVKIAPTEKVTDLKEAIKERKKNAFKHVDADALDLWKIAIPFDNGLMENVEKLDFTQGTLLPMTKLSTLFLDVPVEEQLHVVINAPFPVSEPDLSHPTEKGAFPFSVVEIMCRQCTP